MRWIFLGTVAVCLIGGAATAAPTLGDLQKIQQQLLQQQKAQRETKKKAADLSSEIKRLQKQMIQTANAVQAKEEQLSKLENNLALLKQRQSELEKKLSLSDAQMVQVMKGLQTLALRPKEMIFLNPLSPVETLRSHLLMQHSIPVIGSVGQTLRNDLKELIRTKADIQQQIIQEKTLKTQLVERTAQMNVLLKQKSVLQARYDASHIQAKKKAELLASQANDLKDLLKKLEEEKQRKIQEQQMRASYAAVRQVNALKKETGAKGNAFQKSRGALLYPVRGYVVQNFGDTTVSGSHVKGMTIATRNKAQVIAPFDGTILFAGPFKNYGQLLIIDNGGGYLTLLAGLGTINTGVGQEVLAGEPIGLMDEENPRLYIEIRKNGQPIDPKPWFIPRRS